jgi:hypothetical protein
MDGRIPLVTMKLAELTPAPYNPRKMEPAAENALLRSLERFGLLQPIVWNKRTGNVVGGHRRLKLLMAAGVDVTDVAVGDWSETEEKALNLALNNPAGQGTFTPEAQDLLLELREMLPEVYDELLLWQIHPPEEELVSTLQFEGEETQPDLAPQPYESYDYVVLLFRNSIDWLAAVDHFELKPVLDPTCNGVGLGCVLDGSVYLNKVLKR